MASFPAPSGLPWSVSRILFESQWLYWGLGLLLGIVILYVGYGRKQKLAITIGRVLLIVTALWILAASIVDTPAERLAAAHQSIYTAAINSDSKSINSLLADDFHFGPNDRKIMASAVDEAFLVIKVKSNMVRFYAAEPQGSDRAVSRIHLITNVEPIGPAAALASGGNQYTEWELEWIDVPNQGWRLHVILSAKYGTPGNLVEVPPNFK